jgi:endonuclease I
MKRANFYLIPIFLFLFTGSFAQTNPAAQTLPVNISFGTANYTPPFTGMAAWTGDGTRPYATQAAVEASLPGADVAPANLFAATPSAAPTGGQYGDGAGANGRLTIATSGNATAGTTQTALAVNTTSATGITINYDLSLQVVNPRTIGVVLQYRIGTAGAFTTIAGSPVSYTSGSSNGGDADGATDWDSYSFPLPAAAENQPVVQIRWAVWRSGAGNSSGIGIDNISVSTAITNPCATPTAQPTGLNLTAISSTQVNGTFTAAAPVPDDYLIVRSLSPTLSANPADGFTYTAGQSLGGGNVIQFAAGTTFSDAGLSANTTYYYFIFSVNDDNCTGGPKYLTTLPLTGNITTPALAPCVTPPAPPTGLVLTPGVTGISVIFTATPGATKYLGVISSSPTLSSGPANTTVYTNGQALGGGTVKYYGAATNFVATGLTPGNTYYVFVFAVADGCTGEPDYNASSLNGSATTLTGTGIPPGYYDPATSLLCTPLKTALFNIIKPTTANPPPTYDGICSIYPTTDYRKSDDMLRDIIWDMYSDNPTGADPYEFEYGIDVDGCGGSPNNPPIPGTSEGLMYNREHSFPRSWFGGAIEPMNSDIFHIYPTDKEVNNRRSSFPYGETTTPTWTSLNGSKLGPCTFTGYSGTVFEPINNYKGDFARAQFYMATAYEANVAGWQPNADFILNGTAYQAFDNWYLQLLFKWHTQDPVSQKEIDRNNAVYVIQGNRNPFIDHPEWVFDVWSCTGAISLPINLYNFNVRAAGDAAILEWKADRSVQFSHFEIERSTNGVTFTNRGRVNLQTGSIDYSYSDNISNLSGNIYYRIKMVDLNGDTRYSEIKPVRKSAGKNELVVYPNPAASDNITLIGLPAQPVTIKIYDAFGRLSQQINNTTTGRINVSLLPAGKYALIATSAAGQQTAFFIR